MTTPKPGKPVRGSQSGRPIMALLDLLGEIVLPGVDKPPYISYP